jgi:hypothetical protein
MKVFFKLILDIDFKVIYEGLEYQRVSRMVKSFEADYKFFIRNKLLSWFDKFLELSLVESRNFLVVTDSIRIGNHIKSV